MYLVSLVLNIFSPFQRLGLGLDLLLSLSLLLIWATWKSIPAFVTPGNPTSDSGLPASTQTSLPYECEEFRQVGHDGSLKMDRI